MTWAHRPRSNITPCIDIETWVYAYFGFYNDGDLLRASSDDLNNLFL